jgi:hypothetical protein
MAPKNGLDAEIRDLYRLAPEEFTAAVNALFERQAGKMRAPTAAGKRAPKRSFKLR